MDSGYRSSIHFGYLTDYIRDADLAGDYWCALMSKIAGAVRRAPLRERCLYLKPWDGFKSVAHVLSTVRMLEKRFGPAERIQIPREMMYSPNYRMYGWVTFENPIDQKEWGDGQFRLIEVPNPPVDLKKPGGLGLSDIGALTQPNHKAVMPDWPLLTDKSTHRGSGQSTSDIKMERSAGPQKDIRIATMPLFRSRIIGFAQGFTSFSGFAETPTEEMIKVKRHWEAKAKIYKVPRHASSSASSDPLAEYLDTVEEQEHAPHVLSPEEPMSITPDVAQSNATPSIQAEAPIEEGKATPADVKPLPKPSTVKLGVTKQSISPSKPSRRSAALQLARERGAALERKRLAEASGPKKWNEGGATATESESPNVTKAEDNTNGDDPTMAKKLLGWLRS